MQSNPSFLNDTLDLADGDITLGGTSSSAPDASTQPTLVLHPLAPQPFLLGSLLVGYPDEDFAAFVYTLFDDDQLEALAAAPGADTWEALVAVLERSLSHAEALDDLRSEYIDLFDRGGSANPLYHSEYGRDRAMRKTAELVDLAGFYQAFGFRFDAASRPDMLDHLSIELEFYALMLMKEAALLAENREEGVEIVRDARLRFLREHLGSFPQAVARRPAVSESPLYGPILRWLSALVTAECRRYALTPLPLEWLAGQQADEVVECGAAGACTPGASGPVPSGGGMPV